jgi:hypothetical protein
VSIIIPTRNEAQAIGRVIGDLPADLATEVIVVDNNSIGLLSFRFSSLRLPRGAPTSPSVRGSRVRARPGRFPGTPCSAIGSRPA